MPNDLYYGDNLEVLRKEIPANYVDLIYLDPPFNSQATYNVLFRSPLGAPSAAQIEAFSPSVSAQRIARKVARASSSESRATDATLSVRARAERRKWEDIKSLNDFR